MKESAVHYLIEATNVNAHLWRITLTIAKPVRLQTVSLPVWIPGSYMVREFAKHLQHLKASQVGKPCAVEQLDKCTWRVKNTTANPLEISYEVYAFDNSVRTAWLDAQRAFFNPTSLCLRVEGQTNKPHGLSISTINLEALSAVSTPATGLKLSKTDAKKLLGLYAFDDYDHLADTPFEIGNSKTHWHGSFTVRGVLHEFVVSGAAASFDGERLLSDTKKIVEAEMFFWHGKDGKPPFEKYIFMLNAVDDGYGGLEHRDSTALICSRRDLPRIGVPKQTEGYTTLLGLISHEYFHTWNVKRLKPAEFVKYDYSKENYTRMLWFFEGFTSYFDDLILRRAGLIDQNQYLRLLAKAINQVQQSPGRLVQSVAAASMDAWVKYYRQDENTPNATVSYYTKGSLVALCFDLSLRAGGEKQKTTSLDDVMRLLWKQSKADQKNKGGITEADFAAALRQLSGRSYEKEITAWVHGAADLPLQELLALHGVSATPEPGASLPMAQRLGLRVSESSGALIIKTVLRGGLAEKAGFCSGDEWLAVNDWRIYKLEELSLLCGNAAQTASSARVTVSRDKRLRHLQLSLPGATAEPSSSYMLRSSKDELLSAWLLG